MGKFNDSIAEYIELETRVLKSLDVDAIDAVLTLLEDCLEKERTIYVFGNGGSSATASHFQNDFNKGISEHTEKKFRFVCLNDNVPTIMAIANDIGFEEVFRFQLEGKLHHDDVIMAISGSGNSANVINAVSYAKEQGCKVIGLTGYDGGKLKKMSDISLNVPVNSMQITEDVHMLFDHLMMSVFYKTMCGIDHVRPAQCGQEGNLIFSKEQKEHKKPSHFVLQKIEMVGSNRVG
jgi:D-sedoheptulose 7-phosphate isomerase